MVIDHIAKGSLDLSELQYLVLDEADEMLDLGFLPDVERIMRMLPEKRQTMLFSATMPSPVVAMARRFMRQPTHIRAMGDDQENAHTVKAVEQFVYRAHAMDKVELLTRVLQAKDRGLTMVFCRTKRTAQKVADSKDIDGDIGGGLSSMEWICDGDVSVRRTVSSSRKNVARGDRLGWVGSKASLSKLYSTVSTSRS